MSDLQPARVLDVSPDAYMKLPGFSASLARILIGRSPAHAKDAHDRHIDDDDEDDDLDETKRKKLERGSILHHMVLGKGKRISIIPADVLGKNGAWTAEARGLRDLARRNGMVPVKEGDHEALTAVAAIIRGKILAAGHVLDGQSELAVQWWEASRHGPVQCRAMMDHVVQYNLDGRFATIYEVKIVDDAEPERCMRTAENLGYAIAAAAYPRALNAAFPKLQGRVRVRFLFCEAKRPYEIWCPEPSGEFREIGDRRWLRAVEQWGRGLATGDWPAYPTPEIAPPGWALAREGYPTNE